jgi:hypothetical protein
MIRPVPLLRSAKHKQKHAVAPAKTAAESREIATRERTRPSSVNRKISRSGKLDATRREYRIREYKKRIVYRAFKPVQQTIRDYWSEKSSLLRLFSAFRPSSARSTFCFYRSRSDAYDAIRTARSRVTRATVRQARGFDRVD